MRTTREKVYAALLALGVLAVLVAGARTAATPAYKSLASSERVVVIGVPSLDWEVITPDTMPYLWQLADEGSVGLITTRAARSVTCPWDGWLTLGAGNRARYPATIPEDELPPEPSDPLPGDPAITPAPTSEPPTPEEKRKEQATAGCLAQRGVVPTVAGSKLTPAIAENDKLSFGAEPGALGSAVRCTTVVGTAPILAVGAADADVRPASRGATSEDWAARIADCPLTLVAASHALDRSIPELQALDAAINQIALAAREQDATLIVAGTSQPEYKRAKLHALIVDGPGAQNQLLSSPSTSRAPYSQLIDLAPTILAVLGDSAPTSMTGQVLRGQDRSGALTEQVAEFRTASVAASAHVWMSGKFFTFMAWLTILAAVVLAWLVHRRRGGNRWTRAAGTAVSLLPAASLVANVYPWWSAGRPSVVLITCIAAAWLLLSLGCLLGPWRRYRSGPLLAASAVTFGVLAVDVLTGSHLQLNSPLGYNPIVAGRFTGFGNITFAIFAAAALVLLAAACRLAGSRRRVTLLVVTGGLALIAMVGAPGAGTDFGGVIALAPALFLVWILVTGTRLSRGRLLLVLGSGAAVVMAIAVADYLRPAEDRTHLGRFVGQLLNGTAATIVQRKLSANLRVLTGSVLTILALALVAIVVWQWLDRTSAARRYAAERAPYAAAAVVAVLVMAVVGFAVNDSGIAVTAAALAVTVPALLGILPPGSTDAGPPDGPAPGPPVSVGRADGT